MVFHSVHNEPIPSCARTTSGKWLFEWHKYEMLRKQQCAARETIKAFWLLNKHYTWACILTPTPTRSHILIATVCAIQSELQQCCIAYRIVQLNCSCQIIVVIIISYWRISSSPFSLFPFSFALHITSQEVVFIVCIKLYAS